MAIEIDINTLRSAATLVGFIAFLAIVRYAYSRKRRDYFTAIAADILQDTDCAEPPTQRDHHG